jgi:hypothetical protein
MGNIDKLILIKIAVRVNSLHVCGQHGSERSMSLPTPYIPIALHTRTHSHTVHTQIHTAHTHTNTYRIFFLLSNHFIHHLVHFLWCDGGTGILLEVSKQHTRQLLYIECAHVPEDNHEVLEVHLVIHVGELTCVVGQSIRNKDT